LQSGEGLKGTTAAIGKFQLVYEEEGIQIYRNRWTYPRAFVVHAVEVADDSEAALRRLKSIDFDPSTQAVIEGPRPSDWDQQVFSAGRGLPPSEGTIISQSANSMMLRATADRPGLLVVSETFAPGWRAYVDGKPAPIYPADLTMRAVYLPSGTHTVEFVYFPTSFIVGLGIAGAAACSLLLWVVLRNGHSRIYSCRVTESVSAA
jgi:hypothetical protein